MNKIIKPLIAKSLMISLLFSLEFDIYVLNTDSTKNIEFASFQAGIKFNSEILNNAVQKPGMCEFVQGETDLNDSLVPIKVNTTSPGLIRIAGRPILKKSLGEKIPIKSPGLHLCRIRFTNSVPFKANSSPDFMFTSNVTGANAYATRISVYYDFSKLNLQLDIIPLQNAVVEGNIILNPELKNNRR
jgi:hypothetical protein